jgi:hypothetical protein
LIERRLGARRQNVKTAPSWSRLSKPDS